MPVAAVIAPTVTCFVSQPLTSMVASPLVAKPLNADDANANRHTDPTGETALEVALLPPSVTVTSVAAGVIAAWSSAGSNSTSTANELSSVTHVLDAQVGRPDRFLSPGQVNGDFATWDRYTPSTQSGTVRRFQISTLTTVKVPLPIGKIQYASSTNPSGTIFYVRSGLACGKKVVIREDVPGVSDTALAALPAGYDIYRTFAVDEGGGVTSLYFDRFNCATGAGWNIYKLTIS